MTNITPESQPATQYLSVPGGRIAYDVQGTGPLLVLVPGMGDLRATYRFLTPALVAAGYRVATTDLRGHGESDAAFPSYGDVETAGDISALIDQLGAPAVIVGNSMAAGAAVIVAADHPAQVSGLALLGPFVRNPKSSAVQLALFKVMMAPLWATAAWKAYLPSLYAGTKPVDVDEYRATVVASMRRPGYAKAFSATARTSSHDPAEARIAAASTPTLVVMGDKDPDFKDPAGEAQWIGEAMDAEVVMVTDAGHYPQSQQPEVTSVAILAFLKTVLHRA
ncbi:alpha/beta fold hydrolase [Marisediminicola senii]|uniref:alpha/beta fold hydrolase n=1 Tax=Marisediminicola senii TaxID=2711233 RepID=UPI0013EE1527|nr:alpha/beta hydrolase [Marisediminicola senii]